ncbi:MAG: NADH-quinone oxidoreductase subunit NuoN [Parvibaculaceae bacterium]|nr:NADH-quinone oxidoreductase subunit NuoN [Parvibaculaceae bacterium]
MEIANLPDLGPIASELTLAIGGMALLLLGAFRGDGALRLVGYGAVLIFGLAAVLVIGQPNETVLGFHGAIIMDPFAKFMKVLILIGSSIAVIMSLNYLEQEKLDRFEYPVLIVFATLGMLMMVSANDLLALYMGLELQSLALYVVASFNRDSLRSTESGLKYFVLGALASGMLLYGSSLVYGFSGTTSFPAIAEAATGHGMSLGILFGMVFILAGLAFKVSAVPFHMWTPDVYEGAPTPVTAFFAAAPKIAAVALFIRVMMGAFPDAVDQWQQVIVFISIASMVLGGFAAIGQRNIKRLMAYSSIGHMGFALVGLAAGTAQGIQGVLVYLAIYLVMNAGVFCCILAMRRAEGMVESIDELAGLSRDRPVLAFVFAMFMFSLAGIPPLAGFFAKFYVFVAAMDADLYTLAVIGVLSSVVGAFYYLRIVKIMYFDEPAEPFEVPLAREISIVLTLSSLFTIFFFVHPSTLISLAATAAASLSSGAIAVVGH